MTTHLHLLSKQVVSETQAVFHIMTPRGVGGVGGGGVCSSLYIWHSTDVRAKSPPPFSAAPFKMKVYEWLYFGIWMAQIFWHPCFCTYFSLTLVLNFTSSRFSHGEGHHRVYERVCCFLFNCRFCLFLKDPFFQIILRSQRLSLCRVELVKPFPRTSIYCWYFFHILVLQEYWVLTESRTMTA